MDRRLSQTVALLDAAAELLDSLDRTLVIEAAKGS
jgi:hypothetical protein